MSDCKSCFYYSAPIHKDDIWCAINPSYDGSYTCLSYDYDEEIEAKSKARVEFEAECQRVREEEAARVAAERTQWDRVRIEIREATTIVYQFTEPFNDEFLYDCTLSIYGEFTIIELCFGEYGETYIFQDIFTSPVEAQSWDYMEWIFDGNELLSHMYMNNLFQQEFEQMLSV